MREKDHSSRRDGLVSTEWSMAVVWSCLLGAGLTSALPPASTGTSSESFPRPPRLTGCVFQNRANATCRWEAADMPTTHYSLQIYKWFRDVSSTVSSPKSYNCTTSGTNCTANMTDSFVRFIFCITVTAHSQSLNLSSAPRCQPGRVEVMLPPAILSHVSPVDRKSQCLNVTWRRILAVFPVSYSEIKGGILNSQIEVSAEGQPGVQVQNVTVNQYHFLVCLFRPDTLYTIRLRHRYRGPESPWSPWSNALQGRTAEHAPSAAPAFWRQVKQTDRNGWRLTSLFWKPLPRPLANGRVLFYNVTCQTDGQIQDDHVSCRDLHHTNVSCTLLLPAERCSCTLTASNSAGSSPEAQIWLRGASEAVQPAPSQITARPLDDSNFDVSWTAPVDPSVSGFVVEWFAVRERSSSILHWERLNSSCTTLVITEGIKPLERYALSVTALYGDRGAGKKRMLHLYTRQGAPSAGPRLEVQKISGGRMELSWSPVPVELCRGFVRSYILHYAPENQPARSVFVHGHVHRYSLGKLLPGNYDVFVQANTDAGAGAAGPVTNVHIGGEEVSVVMYAILPLGLTLLALVLMTCLAQNKRVKQKLCQFVPDPSNSSLAHWIPINTLEGMEQLSAPEKAEIKHPEIILPEENELQDSDLEEACDLRTYFFHQQPPLPASGSQTPQGTRIPEVNLSLIRAKTTSDTDLSSYVSIYSNVIFSQVPKNPPASILSPVYRQFNNWEHSAVSVTDVRLQPGGDSEPPEGGRLNPPQESAGLDSPPSLTDELKTFRLFLKQYQSLVSFSDFSSISPSSELLSHRPKIHSPKHPFLQSNFNSAPSLQPNAFVHPSAPSFLPPVLVDFSYCPVKYDPNVSPAT